MTAEMTEAEAPIGGRSSFAARAVRTPAFMAGIGITGAVVLLALLAPVIGRYGPAGNGAGLPNSAIARCPLWLAEWNATPTMPPGWNAWSFWQYTDAGDVAGVTGLVGRSRFAGTLDALTTWWSNG